MSSFPLSRNPLWICLVPAVLAGTLMVAFLGARHDYTGHFSAGYGGTLLTAMIWLMTRPAAYFQRRRATLSLALVCVGCILLGAALEGSVFRIAKFDELDFFNQSIGAVLACLCAMAYTTQEKPPQRLFHGGILIALAFLGLGACFAVT